MQISILIVAIVLRMSTCAHSIATACVCVWVSVCSLTHTYTHTHVYVWLDKHFSPPYTHTHTHYFGSSSLTSTFRQLFRVHWDDLPLCFLCYCCYKSNTHTHNYKQRALAQRKENVKVKVCWVSWISRPNWRKKKKSIWKFPLLIYAHTHTDTYVLAYFGIHNANIYFTFSWKKRKGDGERKSNE